MCEQGVCQLAERAADLLRRPDHEWVPVHDGFGTAPSRAQNAPRKLLAECPAGCGNKIPVLRRVLISCEYNLPDAAIYQAISHEGPCLAIGEVVADKTNVGAGPGQWRKWQGLLWDLYRVAFVCVGPEAAADFQPETVPSCDRCASVLNDVVNAIQPELDKARSEGRIPAAAPQHKERATQPEIMPILSRALGRHGYDKTDQTTLDAPYWPHRGPDIPYRRPDGHAIAVELKVDSDWDHPLNQEVADLLEYHAVLHVRVPPGSRHSASDAEAEIRKAQRKLEDAGRGRFMCIGPPDPAPAATGGQGKVGARSLPVGTAQTGSSPAATSATAPRNRPRVSAQRLVREGTQLCRSEGWDLDPVRYQGYTTFNRSEGQSTICFQVQDDCVVIIKFVREADTIAGGRCWDFVTSGQDTPDNYWVRMRPRDPDATLRDLLPLLRMAWSMLDRLP